MSYFSLFIKKELNMATTPKLIELEVSSTFLPTVALLVDIILVYSSSSDVAPSLGEMIESAIYLLMSLYLVQKNEYLNVSQESRPRRYRSNVEITM